MSFDIVVREIHDRIASFHQDSTKRKNNPLAYAGEIIGILFGHSMDALSYSGRVDDTIKYAMLPKAQELQRAVEDAGEKGLFKKLSAARMADYLLEQIPENLR